MLNLKKNFESSWVPKKDQCIEPYGNLYSDAYQSLISIYTINIVHVEH